MNPNHNEEIEIDLLHILSVVWKNFLPIVLAGILAGAAVYAYMVCCVAPTYKANILVNVNNNAIQSDDKQSVSTSEISASKSLVDTYIVILESRSVMQEVIDRADLSYSCSQLSGMVSAEDVSSTEILKVEVTAYSAKEAALIANTIAEVLPDKIAQIVAGSSAVIVDYAVEPKQPSGPHKSRNAAVGFLAGAFLVAAFVVIRDMLDDTVRDESFLTANFQIPVLASIPDLNESSAAGSYYSYYMGAGQQKRESRSGAAGKEGVKR